MTESVSTKWSAPRDLWIFVTLAVATLGTYAGVGRFAFVQWDDPYYPQNAHLRDGFTAAAVKWAFTSGDEANWHPLTWLSHMLDVRLYGQDPGPQHISGLIIHMLASLMVFAFFRRATGTRWRSALVAFLFALHPLHVQSVAWISERKDVLCAFFWFLTAWMWVRYTERPAVWPYAAALVPFCLGLLSKPMIVSLPLVLLLLDLWPLRRKLSVRLLLEKIPFLVLSAAASVVTYLVQRSAGATRTLTENPFGLRVENALITMWIYIGKTVWPTRLVFFYPYPKSIPMWQASMAAFALIAVSAFVLRRFRRFPYLAVGWFWYVVTLLPVIGLVQVGVQARADRYMYIPMVGLAIMLAWGAADFAARWPASKPWVIALLATACLASIPAAWIQQQYWRNDLALFSHAVEASDANNIAWHNLGDALNLMPGHEREALAAFDSEMKIDPTYAVSHNDRGQALWKLGRKAEAIAEYQTAIRLDNRFPEARVNYGSVLAGEGKWQEAIAQYAVALAADPESPRAWYNRGVALMMTDNLNDAIRSFEHALLLDPGNAEAHNNLGIAMTRQRHWAESIVEFDDAVRLSPRYADAWNNLGEALIKAGRSADAADSLRRAVRLNPQNAGAHSMLAFALANSSASAEANSEAIAELREAVRLDPNLAAAQENLGRLLARNPATLPEAIEHLRIAQRVRPLPAVQQFLDTLENR